ncbi:helix-turn-helix domain-containing protein [Salibacterium halotolerans]|uniref:XRE family transcriptional regulator, master regulator for biofilm formation n=1 Tax=Salibacterium halotolerans TaxID=1884432 RepID=A0A1I5L9R9_9BACI|nr:helix-turn-helix domain-containing protein [Salibacterium halotolerans]SFO93968.1 XRE family transcriptional regulator, master regulator for biofilm formation [Salibacterium halotolerans]
MIGVRIRRERHEQALTIAELAEKSGMMEHTLRDIEEGERHSPTRSEMESVAAALQVPVSSIDPVQEDLEAEWLELVKTAMNSDITKEEFRQFILNEKKKRQRKEK